MRLCPPGLIGQTGNNGHPVKASRRMSDIDANLHRADNPPMSADRVKQCPSSEARRFRRATETPFNMIFEVRS